MPKQAKFSPKYHEAKALWVLNIPPSLSKTGKRARLYFQDKDEAVKAAKRIRERHKKFGVSLSNLDPYRLGEASEAYKLLDKHQELLGADSSLLGIVRGHIIREKARQASTSLPGLFDRYLEFKGHLSEVHARQIRQVRDKCAEIRLALSDVEARHIEPTLAGLAAGTRNRYLRILSTVFNYAIRKGWAKENPVAKLDFVHVAKKSVQIFSNETVAKLLRYAREHEPELLPYFVLGSFCGLRVDSRELTNITWTDVNLNQGTLLIRAEISKTNQRRPVPLSDNAIAWLKLCPLPHAGRIVRLSHSRLVAARRKAFRAVAGSKAKWIPAGLRHSFASAMINSGQSIDATCLALGHQGSPTMLWKHYYLATSKEQALAYWQILP